VGWDVSKILYNAAPNRSVLHTQGWLLSRDPDDPIVTLAMEKTMDGISTPEQVLQSMLEADTTRSIYNGYEFDSVDARVCHVWPHTFKTDLKEPMPSNLRYFVEQREYREA